MKNHCFIIQLKETTTRILLGHTKWDKQELLDKLTEEDREQFFAKARVTNPFLEKPVAKRSTRHKKMTCSICFSDCSQAVISAKQSCYDMNAGHCLMFHSIYRHAKQYIVFDLHRTPKRLIEAFRCVFVLFSFCHSV